MKSIYEAITELEKNTGSGALCTVVRSEGSTPRHVGSKMLVYADGSFIGTVGGGDLEHRVMDEAWIAMSEGTARTLKYSMVDPSRGDPGVCGGTVEVFVEPILPPAMVVVIGAGHVGKAVVHLAKWLGFRVAVSDDRAEFCTPEATPGGDAYYPVEMGKLPEQLKINRRTFIVITSRGGTTRVEADGVRLGTVRAGDRIHIHRSPVTVPLVFPATHNHFAVVAEKLRWNDPDFER